MPVTTYSHTDFTSKDGTLHEGSDDDGEHGPVLLMKTVYRTLLWLFPVDQYGSKIGQRRFRHSALKKLPGSV